MARGTPKLVVQILANTAELIKNLEAGRGAIQAYGPTVAQMQDDWRRNAALIVEKAATITAALKDVGAGTLTAADASKNLKTLDAAMRQLHASGQAIPPTMKSAADELRGVVPSSNSARAALSGLATQLAGMFTVGAIVGFAKSILAAGDTIQKMSDRTSIGTVEIQKLQHIAGQTGTSIESLVSAAQNLQQRLGSGDEGAVGAMKRLGINTEAFAKLDTYQQMTSLSTAIASIKDPTQQASLAAELFGKTWKDILPALKADMKAVGDQAVTMSDETVKSLDRIGDTMAGAKQAAVAWGGSIVMAFERAGFAVGDYLSRFNRENFGVSTSEMLAFQAAINDPGGLVAALESVKSPLIAMNEAAKPIPITLEEVKRVADDLDASMRKQNAARKLAEDFKKVSDAAKKVESEMARIPPALAGIGSSVDVAQLGPLARQVASVEQTARIANFGFQGMAAELVNVGEKTTLALDAMDDWAFVGPRLIEVREETKTLLRVLDDLGTDFAEMAIIGGESFALVAREIGLAVKAAEGFVGMVGAMNKLSQSSSAGGGWSVANLSALAAGWVGVVVAVWSMVDAFEKAQDAAAAEKVRRTWVGLLADDFGMATEASDALWRSIQKSAAALTRGQGLATGQPPVDPRLILSQAEALNLTQIIQELGGWAALSAEQLATVYSRVDDLFDVARVGGALGAQAVKQLDDVLMMAGRDAIQSKGLVSDFFLETVRQAKIAGLVLPQISAVMKQFAQTAVQGFNDLVAGANLAARTQSAFSAPENLRSLWQGLGDLGIQALAVFNAATESGLGFSEALRQMAPGLDQLAASYGQVGGASRNAALETLLLASSILKNNPQLIAAVDGLVAQSKALFNMGALNVETFGAMQRSGVEMYRMLQAEAGKVGGSTKDALLPMQEWLRAAAEQAKRLGLPLDSVTQEMIEQSKQLGLWQATGPDTQQQMIDLTQQVANKLDAVATTLSGIVSSDPLGKMADSTGKVNTGLALVLSQLNAIPNELADPFRNWQIPSLPGVTIPGAALGGLVTATGVEYLATGAATLRARLAAFTPRGTDTVPAMLTPGESVLTVGATQQLGVGMVRYLNRGGHVGGLFAGSGGGSINITIQAWDGESVQDWLDRGGAERITRAIVPELPAEVRRHGLTN